MNIWTILEIEMTKDLDVIKKAYVKKIKKCKPEIDPEGFQLLRSAYEIAQQYAAGNEVVHNLEERNIDKQLKDNNQSSQNMSFAKDPVDMAFYLLDVLIKNEQDAIKLFKEFENEGLFDNLEFSHQFQKALAINLLPITPGYYSFVTRMVDYFNWYDLANSETTKTISGIALRNLLNQVRPFQYYLHLNYLSQFKNKKQAAKEKLDWNDCYAAKMLLNKPNFFKFHLLSIFSKNKRPAIMKMVSYIDENYPQIIGAGMNLTSFYWWYKRRDKNYYVNKIYNLLAIATISAMIFGYFSEDNPDVSTRIENNDVQENSKTKEIIEQTTINLKHHNFY